MKVYVDVGTHRITEQLLKEIDRHDFSLLIEPIPKRHSVLADALSCYKVVVLNQAVSNFEGNSVFKIANRDSCSSLQDFTSEAYSESVRDKFGTTFQTLEEIEVKVSKLSTLLRQFEISHVDFLHIDAQGEDLNVVKGLDEFMFCVKKIELECVSEDFPSLYLNQPSCLEVIDYMTRNQFEERARVYHSTLPREFDVVFEKAIKVI